MSRIELVAFLLQVFVVVKWCGMSRVVGLPTGFLWNVHDGEVPVVWIVEVTRVVNVYDSLVGRSRSGGVGRVKQAGDIRSTGGWGVLMLSEHSVFEGSSQEHEHGRGGRVGEGRRTKDGGMG